MSFWVKVVTQQLGAPIVSFRDRSAVQDTIRLGVVQAELGWRSSGNNYMVPQAPTAAMFAVNAWTCVSIHLTHSAHGAQLPGSRSRCRQHAHRGRSGDAECGRELAKSSR